MRACTIKPLAWPSPAGVAAAGGAPSCALAKPANESKPRPQAAPKIFPRFMMCSPPTAAGIFPTVLANAAYSKARANPAGSPNLGILYEKRKMREHVA
jgi:hypothetical protein